MILSDAFLTPGWSWTLPQGFPALATSSRWFWPFKVCHFDLPGLRYEPETAEKYQKIDGRPADLPTVQPKKVANIKVAPPLESSFCWLDDDQKLFCISTLLARVIKRQRFSGSQDLHRGQNYQDGPIQKAYWQASRPTPQLCSPQSHSHQHYLFHGL